MKNIIFLLLFFCFGTVMLNAQSFNIGVRAGLNYNKFLGPLEEGETAGFSSGFHFGLSYQYNIVDNLGIRAELQYSQMGGRKEYTGPSFYVIRYNDETVFEPGTFTGIDNDGDGKQDQSGYLLEVSNAYINIPITAHLKINSKIEILAGAYVGFNINPTANGRLRFDSTNNPDDIFFLQTLSYNYYQDESYQWNTRGGTTNVYVENDTEVAIAKVAGAYYLAGEKDGSTYQTLDLGFIGGLNYYFNKGFYAGARLSYGLLDVTNNKMDFSLREYGTSSFVTRDDKDTNLGLEFSLGFKF